MKLKKLISITLTCLYVMAVLIGCTSLQSSVNVVVTPSAIASTVLPSATSMPTPTSTPVPPTATTVLPTTTPIPPMATPTAASTTAPTMLPTASPSMNKDDPNRAGTIDGQPHSLQAKSAVWYRFDYAINHLTGERSVFTITLVNGNDSGVGFEVYAPENINGWWDNHPTGRGTVQMIDCDTGEPSESGECQSPDLSWRGKFGADGTYYVRVINSNNSPSNYLLTIQ